MVAGWFRSSNEQHWVRAFHAFGARATSDGHADGRECPADFGSRPGPGGEHLGGECRYDLEQQVLRAAPAADLVAQPLTVTDPHLADAKADAYADADHANAVTERAHHNASQANADADADQDDARRDADQDDAGRDSDHVGVEASPDEPVPDSDGQRYRGYPDQVSDALVQGDPGPDPHA
jgi:hypothetical protein